MADSNVGHGGGELAKDIQINTLCASKCVDAVDVIPSSYQVKHKRIELHLPNRRFLPIGRRLCGANSKYRNTRQWPEAGPYKWLI